MPIRPHPPAKSWRGQPSMTPLGGEDQRIDDLQRQVQADHDAIKPLLDLYNASKIIGRILVIIGGIAVGAATIFSAVSGYWGHLK